MLTGPRNAAAQQAALEYIIEGYTATKYTNYLTVGGFALVVADYLHTLPDEVRLIWPTPLSAPKVLFYILRYYLFVHHIFAVLYGERVDLSPSECASSFIRVAVSTTILITFAEAILFLRVYAFSGKQRSMLLFLSLQFIAIHASVFAVLAKFLQSVKYTKYPFPNMTCMPSEGESELLGAMFALLLGSVIVVMFIMVYVAFLKHRDVNSALMTIFYRDGIFYFICISALASANIFVNFVAPHGYKFLFVQAEVDIHVILSTRMLLHLRKWAERERVGGCGKGRRSIADESTEPATYWTVLELDHWTTFDNHDMENHPAPLPSHGRREGSEDSSSRLV